MAKKEVYDGNSIEVLEFPENVRTRPGMYISGATINGMHQIFKEIFDNSLDEATAGHCNSIVVTKENDNYISVLDNGRGIPTGINKIKKVSALELVFTTLHAGGKFRNEKEGAAFNQSAGLNGVGASVSNAVSEHLQVWVQRKNTIWTQSYEKGIKTCEVKKTKKCPITFPDSSGTYVRFKPDPSIFKHIEVEWDYSLILRRCREVAFLTPGLQIKIQGWENQDDFPDITFKYDNGLNDYIDYYMKDKTKITENINIEFELKKLNCSVQACLNYESEYTEHITSFANNINTHEGGVHKNAFLNALLRCIVEIGEKAKITKDFGGKAKKSDIQEGLFAIISVKLVQPEFEGQTKTKLGNPEIRQPLEEQFYSILSKLFERKLKNEGKAIAEKILQSVIARENARKAKNLVRKKGGLDHFTTKGKLADCESKKPEECEICLVEGDSAGGCFSGETEISLVDGHSISFKKIIKEQKKGIRHFTYTIKENGTIGVEEIINPRITKKKTKVIKVYLDNGESVVCTPDHEFMLADGSYKEADKLNKKDSLMPLYRDHSSQEMKGCRISHIEQIKELYDVYDVEIPNTNNFALKSGVFVHNSVKQGREKRFQAVLPLRGKVINVEKTTINKAMENKEIRSLITALNVTPQANGVVPDADDLRYHKIIINTDADVDGAHIACLLLVFFYKFMKTLIERGHIYIACPPLFRIRKGSMIKYFKDDEELEEYFKTHSKNGVEVNRFKGLGEMNPEQLSETVLNPKTRTLIQISIEDAEDAKSTVESLFGKDVDARKKFLFRDLK